jgi:hypothetical protein
MAHAERDVPRLLVMIATLALGLIGVAPYIEYGVLLT